MEVAGAVAKFACELGKFEARKSGDEIILEFDPPIAPGQERFFKGKTKNEIKIKTFPIFLFIFIIFDNIC